MEFAASEEWNCLNRLVPTGPSNSRLRVSSPRVRAACSIWVTFQAYTPVVVTLVDDSIPPLSLGPCAPGDCQGMLTP